MLFCRDREVESCLGTEGRARLAVVEGMDIADTLVATPVAERVEVELEDRWWRREEGAGCEGPESR